MVLGARNRPGTLQENNAPELANESARYIGYSYKPYNTVEWWDTAGKIWKFSSAKPSVFRSQNAHHTTAIIFILVLYSRIEAIKDFASSPPPTLTTVITVATYLPEILDQ